jgi:hypothetical protein
MKVMSKAAGNNASYLAWAVEIIHAKKTETSKLVAYT